MDDTVHDTVDSNVGLDLAAGKAARVLTRRAVVGLASLQADERRESGRSGL
jgi:hypothetical protein